MSETETTMPGEYTKEQYQEQSRQSTLLRTDSNLSQIDKPERGDNETKAHYCWRIIRSCITTAVDVLNKVNAKERNIRHGIQHERHILHPHGVTDMLFNHKTKEYFTVDGSVVRTFDVEGRKTNLTKLEEPFDHLICAAEMRLFVGWTLHSESLLLMDPEFNVTSSSKAIGQINAALYNGNVDEVITIGCGFVTSWVFRYGGRHLLPRKTTREGFDPSDMYTQIVLEETASRQQKLYAACGTKVTVMNVFEGKVMGHYKDLHVRAITALGYFNPLKYLITGAKDGSIKVWDESWHVQLVFVGHNDTVTSLALYPYGPYIMSASHDNSLRVWSLETCDQVDRLDVDYPVNSLGTIFNHNDFFSTSGTCADLWTVKHIHSLHTTIASKALVMKSTDHPHHPMRCVLQCRDSSVRIISPTTGDVITSLITDSTIKLHDAAYSIGEELLFTVYDDGTMLKSSTKTNPCEVLAKWSCPSPTKACNYLLVYEYIITPSIGSGSDDKWAGMSRAVVVKGLPADADEDSGTEVSKNTSDINKILLLGGRKDGHICVYNRTTGEVEFEIEAHGTKGVLNMSANSKNDCLVSAGLDNIIKVWRLYPYAQESLAPLLSFYCAHTPIQMTVMKSKLMVAFQEHISATYSIVMYNLQEKNRQDHGPQDDHMDSITGLSSCAKMKLIASSSVDGTIKIWDEHNHLLRCININVVPNSVTFCSHKGDLLVGVGQHVHFIGYKSYLPRLYRQKMVAMHFNNLQQETALPYNDTLVHLLSRDEQKRLKAARSSFKFTHFVDILTEEESNEVLKEKREKGKAFAAIKALEDELAQIRDGTFIPPKKKKPTKQMEKEAFDNYMKLFYDKPRIPMPDEDIYAEEKLIYPQKVVKDVFRPSQFQEGFFPSKDDASPTNDATIKADCYIPNSVLVKLLWPQHGVEHQPVKRWTPPGLSEEQMKSLDAQNKGKKKKKDESFRETVMIFDYGDDEEETAVEPSDPGEEEEEPESDFMKKMKEVIAKPTSPEPIVEEPAAPQQTLQDTTQTEASVQSQSSKTQKPAALSKPKMKSKAQLVQKLAPRQTPIKSPSPVPTPPPPKRNVRPIRRVETPPPPTPPRPVTPLPEFIAQFIGLEWFDKYFPNCNTNTMPKPWSINGFVTMLVRVLKVAEFSHKIDVARALSYIHKNQGISNRESVSTALFGILRSNTNPPSPSDKHGQIFIISSLQLLHLFENRDLDYYVELLTQFLDGDKTIRAQVVELLKSCGVKDRHNHVVKELDSWDIWSLPDGDRLSELRKMSTDWLEKWLVSFKRHLEIVIEKLKKGHKVQSHVPAQKKEGKNSILKKPGNDSSEDPQEGAQGARQVTVTFEKAPDVTAIDNATYVEAINYFCEMETEKELDRIRSGGVTTLSDKPVQVKNTVLVLPKVQHKTALVRLGESHTSQHKPKRDPFISTEFKLPAVTSRGLLPQPGDLYSFPSCINLPLNTVYMNPFPSPLDEIEMQNTQPVLLTLKTSQKYYVPERSIVVQDN